MIESGVVIKNDAVWQGHPDVAFFQNHFYVVFRESSAHRANENTTIRVVKSLDGLVYHSETVVMRSEGGRYNCPRLKVINNKMYVICDFVMAKSGQDFVVAENDTSNTSVHIIHTDDGFNWHPVIETNIRGIVPDRICLTYNRKWLITSHRCDHISKELVQDVWCSSQGEGIWGCCATISRPSFNLCEGSICEDANQNLICLMRENSQKGYAANISFSKDCGESWSTPGPTRLFGCHRPALGRLRSGNFLVTYREQTSIFQKRCWAKNTFAALIDHRSLCDSSHCNRINILPLEHDSATHSDGGYTGWIQLPDGRIYVVNYVVCPSDSHKIFDKKLSKDGKPFIKWYMFSEEDF